jgi:NAD(P)-dependent dehydrogenase (short-subunit alcohol dehydrogenase family)
MRLRGAVALVVGAGTAVGAAVVRGLLERDVAKVYADAPRSRIETWPPGAAPQFVDLDVRRHIGALARELSDTNLLIHCLDLGPNGDPSHEVLGAQGSRRRSPTVGTTLRMIDAFAPVLCANSGGAVVNVLCTLHAGDTAPTPSRPLAEWMLSNQLEDRLAAQQTQLLFLGAQLVVAPGYQAVDDQSALARHVAERLLDQLDTETAPQLKA